MEFGLRERETQATISGAIELLAQLKEHPIYAAQVRRITQVAQETDYITVTGNTADNGNFYPAFSGMSPRHDHAYNPPHAYAFQTLASDRHTLPGYFLRNTAKLDDIVYGNRPSVIIPNFCVTSRGNVPFIGFAALKNTTMRALSAAEVFSTLQQQIDTDISLSYRPGDANRNAKISRILVQSSRLCLDALCGKDRGGKTRERVNDQAAVIADQKGEWTWANPPRHTDVGKMCRNNPQAVNMMTTHLMRYGVWLHGAINNSQNTHNLFDAQRHTS